MEKTSHIQPVGKRRDINIPNCRNYENFTKGTAARDIQFLKAQATEQLKFHIQERLPWEHNICSEGLSQIIQHAWSIILEGDAKSNKIAALSLIAQCYKDRLEIATNAHVVTEALQHVERIKNQNIIQRGS